MTSSASKSATSLALSLALSLLVLLGGVWVVLTVWYPRSFCSVSGIGRIGAYAVGVHLGLTALLILPWRSRGREGSRVQFDVAVLTWILIAAALLSLSVLASGRPVALVYAVDRVTLVRANEIRASELATLGSIGPGLRWSGPLPLWATSPSKDADRLDAIQLAIAGFDLPQRPARWEPVQLHRALIVQSAKHVSSLKRARHQPHSDAVIRELGLSHYLPMDGVTGHWVLAVDTQLRNYVPIELDEPVAPEK